MTFPVPGGADFLFSRRNLADLGNPSTARTNLGVDYGSLMGNAGNTWIPNDAGLLVSNFDLPSAANSTTLTAGQLLMVKLMIRHALTATNVCFVVPTAGVGASTGSFGGLYNSAGTLLSGSADIGAALLGTGALTVPLTTPQALAAGSFVWAAILVNLATTQPNIVNGTANGTVANAFQAGTALSCGTSGAGLVALPGSVSPAGMAVARSFWAGIS